MSKKLLVFILLCISHGCGLYSFTGASLPPDVKTFTVLVFDNQSEIVVPSLGQGFTDALRDKLNNQTTLSMIRRNGDLEFSGSITRYQVSPVAPTANETAAQNRLTIAIQVDFLNKKYEKESWNTTFTRFADYDSNVDLATVEDQKIEEIVEQIVQDIFNKAVANW